MATNLPPELLAAYQRDRNAGYLDPATGQWVSTSTGGAMADGGMQIGNYNASGGISPDLMAAMGFADPSGQHYTFGNGGERGSGKIGDKYQIMDSQGAYTGKDGTYSAKGMDPALMALLAAGAMYGGASLMNGGFLGAGGAASGAGTAAGTGGMVNGAFLGEGALSGVGAWDGALAAAGAGGAGVGGAAAGGVGGGSGAVGTMPSMELLPATMGENALPGLMSTAGGGSGPLSGAASALKGAGSWLAPIVGAALGSQPTTTENNTTKKMDPRMDALVYGDGGFLNNATDWYKNNKSGMNDQMRDALARNRSLLNDPATTQGYKNMATQGQGLLSRPVASNPFTMAQRPQFGSNLLQQYLNGGLLGQ